MDALVGENDASIEKEVKMLKTKILIPNENKIKEDDAIIKRN